MYQSAVLRSLYVKTFANRIISTPAPRSYSSKLVKNDADLDAAREWFSKFNRNTIPESISTTTYSHSSGAGGQKVNKTSSKANTTWPLNLLQHHVPKALMVALRGSRRYVMSSDSIQIQCDSHRSRTDNKTETHRRLWEEIKILYEKNVPGVTSPEKKAQIAAM
ncbi:hypothetical protein B0O99DRAFT_514934 [Bisporella sp. PMI_857]|nr:hypothetical protein B0O99DRAFT_514934 [Bisporella sp. PMI_857]